MIVFISSPYKAVFDAVSDKKKARAIIFKHARAGARKVLEMGHIPLSPVLAFDGVYDENTQRELAIADSLNALKWCEGVCFVRSQFSAASVGMMLEEDCAKRLKKNVFELNLHA